MSFLKNLTAFLPVGKKEEKIEYFFAVNIGEETLTAALWSIAGKSLKVLEVASQNYSSNEEIITVLDKLLDQVLGLKDLEPQKILFGVPNSWILDDNLKDEYLKILRHIVKELELTPMAYVSTSNALVHFLEKQEGIPTTAILVGFEKVYLTVTVARAGKIDGVKVVKRGETAGADIERALLTFTDVETLPSKILIYGTGAAELKSQLLSFPWMSKMSFLHFPKIEVLDEDLEVKSVCLAGGSEMDGNISYEDESLKKPTKGAILLDNKETDKEVTEKDLEDEVSMEPGEENENIKEVLEDDLGFVVGDIEETKITNVKSQNYLEDDLEDTEQSGIEERELTRPERFEVDDFEAESEPVAIPPKKPRKKFNLKSFLPKGSFMNLGILLGIAAVIALAVGAYVFLPKADVRIYVEPKILEKDAQVVADPNQKAIDEAAKIIPGQVVDVDISGSAKDSATGKKQIGDPAKGTIVVYNKTSEPQTLSKGTQISSGGIKFTLDSSVSIASQSATKSDSGTSITYGKANSNVTAVVIGADGNLPSGSDFIVAGFSPDKMAAKSEGNFSGGTSKDVTVVSSDDAQRLLAKLSSDLRSQAQQKLQEKYPNKKILEEALSENITKKSYNKNVNDQAGEFSLNLTVKYKGTAFDDADLKTIVSKLVTTQVPDGFRLDLSETETQADVSKLEKNGKLIFLAKFKARLIPRIDTDKIVDQIKFKTPDEVMNSLKGMDNVLGSEVNITPRLPKILERLPLLSKNIKIEVGLK